MVKLKIPIVENQYLSFNSSRLQMFFKVGVLESYAFLTGKYLRWIHFLIMLQSFRLATLLKRNSNNGVFL